MDRVCQVCGIMTALKSPLVVAAKSSTVFGLRRIVFFSDRDVLYSHIHRACFYMQPYAHDDIDGRKRSRFLPGGINDERLQVP